MGRTRPQAPIKGYDAQAEFRLEDWMNKRAIPKARRMGYFKNLITNAKRLNQPEHMPVPQYFRRYQFDVQKACCKSRHKDREDPTRCSIRIGAIGAVLAGPSIANQRPRRHWCGDQRQ